MSRRALSPLVRPQWVFYAHAVSVEKFEAAFYHRLFEEVSATLEALEGDVDAMPMQIVDEGPGRALSNWVLPPTGTKDVRSCHFRLPSDIENKLATLAEALGCTKTHVICSVIESAANPSTPGVLPQRQSGKLPTRSCHFRLPHEVDRKLGALAEEHRCSRTRVLCAAIERSTVIGLHAATRSRALRSSHFRLPVDIDEKLAELTKAYSCSRTHVVCAAIAGLAADKSPPEERECEGPGVDSPDLEMRVRELEARLADLEARVQARLVESEPPPTDPRLGEALRELDELHARHRDLEAKHEGLRARHTRTRSRFDELAAIVKGLEGTPPTEVPLQLPETQH